jgi:ApaG protein
MSKSASYQIECQAVVKYLAQHSDPARGVWAFAYTIRIINTGEVAAQLISRHWIITDGDGQTEEVQGLGVVGKQPLLQPGEAFEYTSGTRLSTPNGQMRGSYFFVAEDATRFDAEISAFDLLAIEDGGSARVLH